MVAMSPRIRKRAEVEYFSMQSRSALNREASRRMFFSWTLNPYRGCEFGCKYCYARYTHEFMEMWDGLDFERKIYAKTNASELVRAEFREARDQGFPIALGTATDPYQPAELQFKITRQILQVVSEFQGVTLSITTKSVMILRDLDLLAAISERNRLTIHLTITTTDPRLARMLEPKAPPPAKRLEVVRLLAAAGIHVGVNAMPILPGLTDSKAALEALVQQSAEAGAKFVHGQLLFLMPSAMKQFMPFLEREFPRLAKRYRTLYGKSAYLRGEYKDELAALMARLRARYGLENKQEEKAPCSRPVQLGLPYRDDAPKT